MLFCCLEAFLWKFTEKLYFNSKNWLSQEQSQKYSEGLLFSTSLKTRKSRGKLRFGVNKYFSPKQKNGIIINKNCFSTQNVPHLAKLYFSIVMKHLL